MLESIKAVQSTWTVRPLKDLQFQEGIQKIMWLCVVNI